MSTDITLVLGGARSGKSRYAEGLVTASPGPRVYIATAQVWDSEMADRVARHKQDRGPGWTTVEEPLDLPGALRRHAGSGANVLVDCLTLWLSNLMMADADVPARSTELLAALAGVEGRVVLAPPRGRRRHHLEKTRHRPVSHIAELRHAAITSGRHPPSIYVAAGPPAT
ncbi:bifunctional adenosylcobinamide kinase/adenosylcobinamide-phosphate guanylyltransferase, partial [Azospirillum brasilense]|uniref:bifunctional adenosylcobinamide kinase/adenosylcobinamide-phosphate guanylyltransferase n=1 Tax=Azospirillum brasilense TaxID=192 RepID=UPI001FFECFE0